MKRFIVIDTCIWITLAGEPKLYELIQSLDEIVKCTDFCMVLPESVAVEFKRNRDKPEKEWTKKINSKISNLKEISQHFPEHKDDVVHIQQELQRSIAKGLDQVRTNIKIIDKIFRRSKVINTTEKMMAEAARRVLHRVPPSSKSQGSSVGDCLLWLTVLELLREGEVWFCTENKADFSMQNQHKFPHPDLDQEAFVISTKGHFNYSIEIDELIKKIFPLKKDLPKYSDYIQPDLSFCPRCSSESLIVQTFPLGWRYHCLNCGYGTSLTIED